MKKPIIGILAIILSVICFCMFINEVTLAHYGSANYKYLYSEHNKQIDAWASATTNRSSDLAFFSSNLTPLQLELKKLNYNIQDIKEEEYLNEDLHTLTIHLERYRLHSTLAILSLLMTVLFIFVAIIAWKTHASKTKNK